MYNVNKQFDNSGVVGVTFFTVYAFKFTLKVNWSYSGEKHKWKTYSVTSHYKNKCACVLSLTEKREQTMYRCLYQRECCVSSSACSFCISNRKWLLCRISTRLRWFIYAFFFAGYVGILKQKCGPQFITGPYETTKSFYWVSLQSACALSVYRNISHQPLFLTLVWSPTILN